MKITQILFACSLFLSLISCNKNEGKKKNADATLVGKWELRETSAAMNPVVSQYQPGNGNLLVFTKDGYEIHKDGQATKTGKYQVIADSTVETNVCSILPESEYAHRLVYDRNNNQAKIFFQISGDTLKLISGCYAVDAGHKEVYQRITN